MIQSQPPKELLAPSIFRDSVALRFIVRKKHHGSRVLQKKDARLIVARKREREMEGEKREEVARNKIYPLRAHH
jgi:hypothetical protein